MNKVLWVLQTIMGVYFVFVGITHFVVPDGLPTQMEWMYDLDDTTHSIAGIAEILGGLGLLLPSYFRIFPELTVFAAVGLVIVMLAAAVWHVSRGEGQNVAFNLVNLAVLSFIAYGRWRLHPLRKAATA
jgi:uncharacterized membrane protein